MSDFDPDAYLKEKESGFDPDAYLAKKSAPVDGSSAGGAFLDHFGNAALLGYGPQVIEGISRAAAPVYDAITGSDVSHHLGSYVDSRDETLKKFDKEKEEHPVASGVGTAAGALSTAAIPMGAAVKGASLGGKMLQGAKAGALMGGISNPGDTEGEISPLQVGDRAKNAAIGGAVGAAVPAAIEYGGKAASATGRYLRDKAAALAEKATGATRVGAEKFADGTGRELLDRGIVKFGSTPKDIAANAGAAMDAAQQSKMDLLENQFKDTKVDRNKVYNAIRAKIAELSGDESQTGLVKQLESKLDDITGVAEKTGSEVPLVKSEGIRRGFDKAAKWDMATDAPTREANKIVANAYRNAGSEAAEATSPELAEQFAKEKATQHLLIPVEEAATKRALQLQQAPHGGLLDMASAGAGGAIGAHFGPIGVPVGMAAGLASKALRPRYASMGAVGADFLGNMAGGAAGLAAKADPRIAAMIAQRAGKAGYDVVTGKPMLEPDPEPMLKDNRLMDIFKNDPKLLDAIQDESIRAKVKRAIAGKRGP